MEEKNKLLYKIRSLDPSLSHARFSSALVDKTERSVKIVLICENSVPDDLRAEILGILNRELPPTFLKIALSIKKIRADEELVHRTILSFIRERRPSAAYAVSPSDVTVNMAETCEKGDLPIFSFNVSLGKDIKEQFEKTGAVEEMERYLRLNFCEEFRGSLSEKEVTTDFSVLNDKPVAIDYIHYRSIKVADVVKLDEIIGTDTAVYIDDISGPMDSVYLCGEIISVRERLAQSGKPFYLIEFSDRSGKIVGTYFNKKATEDKIRRLKEGDGIIVQGSVEIYRDRLSLVIKKINYCTFPKDFKPERKQSKVAPTEYSLIFPVPNNDYRQTNLFTNEPAPPQNLAGRTFVVFDTETTGKETSTDFVTEIGAVKIVNGKITEVFGSLINPGVKISAEITGITGITDAMVADKPPFSAVCGDIYKFFEGAILVAHNIDFDYKFLRRLSAPEGYFYYNPYIDTLAFARSSLFGLKNYKLCTIAEHYGIDYNPHRAVDDAYATALVFMKMCEEFGLPEISV